MLFNLFAEEVFSYTLDSLFDNIIDKDKKLNKKIDAIATKLDDISENLEQLLTSDFHAALEFIKLKKLDKALESLINAKSKNRYSPVVLLWLS